MDTPQPPNHTRAGQAFQGLAAELLGRHFGVAFLTEQARPIGQPPKAHRFDLVSTDGGWIGECKHYTWTSGGNIPNAKLAVVTEAVFYLQHAPPEAQRFVALRRSVRPKRAETLADYYFRIYRHLLHGVFIVEIDPETRVVRDLRP